MYFNQYSLDFLIRMNFNHLKGMVHKFCHNLLTLMTFQTCMTFFLSVEHKSRYFEELVSSL